MILLSALPMNIYFKSMFFSEGVRFCLDHRLEKPAPGLIAHHTENGTDRYYLAELQKVE